MSDKLTERKQEGGSAMLCNKCQQREAKIYCTEIVNGLKKEQYLCEQCAAEYASFQMGGEETKKEMPSGSLFSGLLEKEYKNQEEKMDEMPTCSNCGMSYSEFLKTGKFGCAQCYSEFGKVFDKSLKQIQGNDTHHGKIPNGFVSPAQKAIDDISEIDKLTLKLQYAIEKEQYEEAAKLRDMIHKMRNNDDDDSSAQQEEIDNA